MVLDKYSLESDAIADLYRASFYLAKKSKDTSLSFLLKPKKVLGKRLILDVERIAKGEVLKTSRDYSYWAEKILDEYKRLKISLFSN